MQYQAFFPFLAMPALLAACTGFGPVAPRADLLGTRAPPQAATRTIAITPETTAVRVVGGDVVRFVAGGQAFAWDFHASPIVAVFTLKQLAPPGMLERDVLVYITPDPLYHEGSLSPGPDR